MVGPSALWGENAKQYRWRKFRAKGVGEKKVRGSGIRETAAIHFGKIVEVTRKSANYRAPSSLLNEKKSSANSARKCPRDIKPSNS